MRTLSFVFMGLLLLAGCDPSFTSSAKDGAAIRVLGLPSGLGEGYGEKIATATDPDEKWTMAFVGVHDASVFGMYTVWRDGRLALAQDGDPLGAGCSSCNGATLDGKSFGLGAVATEQEGKPTICGVAPDLGFPTDSGGDGVRNRGIGFSCGGKEHVDTQEVGTEDDGENLGHAFAALHGGRIFTVDGDRGDLVAATITSTNTVTASNFTFDGKFGQVLASAVLGNVSWVAASEGDHVAILRITGGGSLTAQRTGCLDAKARTLALADIDGDGLPEVFVGNKDGVSLFDGDSLGASCDDDGAAPSQTANCDDFTGPEITGDCGDGAAVAVGDINGDGAPELIVGLPGTEVGGKAGAGAVFAVAIVRGDDNSDDGGGAFDDDAGESDAGIEDDMSGPSLNMDVMSSMVDSEPNSDSALGYSVAALRTYPDAGPRDEIMAGSPGERAAFVFLCSGFEGDKPGKGLSTKCQPK